MADEFGLIGVDALSKKLQSLKQETKFKGGRFALRRAANIVAQKAKEGALRMDDSETGRKISDNVAVRWNARRFKASGDLAFRVGILQGALLPKPGEEFTEAAGGPTPHWRLLEFGTEKMAARPFMRPALENNINAVIREFVVQYDKAIDRALKRAK